MESFDHSAAMQPINGRMTAIKYNVHTCFQDKTKERMGEIAHQLALPVHIALLNLDGNMNIAMTVRTAAVLGIGNVWIIGRRKYDARPEVGAKHYVNVHKVEKVDDPKAFFQGLGLQPILVEQGGTALEEMNFKPFIRGERPVCFLMGSESHGISKEWLEALKDAPRVSISQYGLIRSLNVSIAASIVLYEYLKQWREMRRDV